MSRPRKKSRDRSLFCAETGPLAYIARSFPMSEEFGYDRAVKNKQREQLLSLRPVENHQDRGCWKQKEEEQDQAHTSRLCVCMPGEPAQFLKKDEGCARARPNQGLGLQLAPPVGGLSSGCKVSESESQKDT